MRVTREEARLALHHSRTYEASITSPAIIPEPSSSSSSSSSLSSGSLDEEFPQKVEAEKSRRDSSFFE